MRQRHWYSYNKYSQKYNGQMDIINKNMENLSREMTT